MKIQLAAMIWEQLGFQSGQDLLQSTVAWKHKISALYIFSISIAGIITAAEAFTDSYIYSPSLGIAILWVTSILDIILGLNKALFSKLGIKPTRLSRSLVRVLMQTILVSLFFHMSKVWSYLITSWMVDSLLIIFTMSTFYSVLQNAAYLGLITKEQYGFIESLVNIKELINKIRKK